MSDLSTTARPYAKAVYELASENNATETWSDALAYLSVVCEDEQIKSRLDDPTVTREKMAELLVSICGDKIDDQGANLVKLMAESGRLSLMSEVTGIYEELVASSKGMIDAKMVSAFEVTEAQKESVIASLKKRFNKDVRLEVSVDADLIGGAVITAGDLVIDGSVKGRMAKMSTTLAR